MSAALSNLKVPARRQTFSERVQQWQSGDNINSFLAELEQNADIVAKSNGFR
jgi:hypothetical protein